MNRACCGQNKLLKVHGIPMWSVPQLAWTCIMKVCSTKRNINWFYPMTTFSYSNHDQEVRVF